MLSKFVSLIRRLANQVVRERLTHKVYRPYSDWGPIRTNLRILYKYADQEAQARDRQIKNVESVAKTRDSELRQRIHRLERRIKELESTRSV